MEEPGRLQSMGLQRVRWRSLVGYSPWGCKESDMTERLHFKKDKKLYFSNLIKGGHEGTQIINCPFSGTLKSLGHLPSREEEAFLRWSGRRWVMKGKRASSSRAILRVQVEAEDTTASLKHSCVLCLTTPSNIFVYSWEWAAGRPCSNSPALFEITVEDSVNHFAIKRKGLLTCFCFLCFLVKCHRYKWVHKTYT